MVSTSWCPGSLHFHPQNLPSLVFISTFGRPGPSGGSQASKDQGKTPSPGVVPLLFFVPARARAGGGGGATLRQTPPRSVHGAAALLRSLPAPAPPEVSSASSAAGVFLVSRRTRHPTNRAVEHTLRNQTNKGSKQATRKTDEQTKIDKQSIRQTDTES